MTPQQAHELIDSVIAQVALNREQRQQTELALAILKPQLPTTEDDPAMQTNS